MRPSLKVTSTPGAVPSSGFLRFCLFMGIFCLPLSFDYTLVGVQSADFIGWTSGFLITLSDLFFFAILIRNAFIERPYRPTERAIRHLFLLPMVLFLLASLISVSGAIWRIFCFFEIAQYLKTITLYYFVTTQAIEEEGNVTFLCKSLTIVFVFQSLLAIVQFVFQDFYNVLHTGSPIKPTYFGDFFRSQGTLSQPNGFSALLVPLLLLIYARYLVASQERTRTLLRLLMIGSIALLLSFSRQGWLAFLVSIPILVLGGKHQKPRSHIMRPIWIILSAGVLLSGFILARLTTDDQGSAQDRLYLMRIAWQIIKSNYICGIGINNYWYAMHPYIPPDYNWDFVYIVHNVYLLVFAETGIIGFAAIILFFVLPIIKTYQMARNDNQGLAIYSSWLTASFSALAIMNLVDLNWSAMIIHSFYFFLLGIANGINRLNCRPLGEAEGGGIANGTSKNFPSFRRGWPIHARGKESVRSQSILTGSVSMSETRTAA